ncbi:MAG: hypothetical protein IKN55_10900 [Oscillospiraceae bacterium]|nr:hypothetical protein [Oscillospiraceae bacterium]
MNEKLREVLADEGFVKSYIEAENEAAVQQLFADKGVEMSLTEIELMKEMIGAVADGKITEEQLEKLSQAGELSEEELTEAAGGWNPLDLVTDKTEITWDPIIGGDVIDEIYKRTASAPKIIKCVAGVAAIGVTAFGIYKFKDEIASGAKTAYGWVEENITRW